MAFLFWATVLQIGDTCHVHLYLIVTSPKEYSDHTSVALPFHPSWVSVRLRLAIYSQFSFSWESYRWVSKFSFWTPTSRENAIFFLQVEFWIAGLSQNKPAHRKFWVPHLSWRRNVWQAQKCSAWKARFSPSPGGFSLIFLVLNLEPVTLKFYFDL